MKTCSPTRPAHPSPRLLQRALRNFLVSTTCSIWRQCCKSFCRTTCTPTSRTRTKSAPSSRAEVWELCNRPCGFAAPFYHLRKPANTPREIYAEAHPDNLQNTRRGAIVWNADIQTATVGRARLRREPALDVCASCKACGVLVNPMSRWGCGSWAEGQRKRLGGGCEICCHR